MKLELAAIGIVLLALNWQLVFGIVPVGLVLLPDEVLGGEIWRLITFALVHNSVYHLALDGSAVLTLYSLLPESRSTRAGQFFACALCSGVVPLFLEPNLNQIGLCGLSGAATGLITIIAWNQCQSTSQWANLYGRVTLAGLMLKIIYEMATGHPLFESWHLGNIGVLVPSCHLGGLIGGLLCILWMAGGVFNPEVPAKTSAPRILSIKP